MRWPTDAKDWPLTAFSRQIQNPPHRWHVQEAGAGKTILLIHGAGGATQSFRNVLPLLAQTHHVVAPDLPGQGFTQAGAQQRYGLVAMAEDIASLCEGQGWRPDVIVGHSAGAAIALQLCLIGMRPAQVVGINAALANFQGMAGWLFPMMAKALAATPFSASVFAATATPKSVRKLIDGTGSKLDDAGVGLYHRLASDKGHVDATLSMMAQWSLDNLLDQLDQIDLPVHLITGSDDLAVPPSTSKQAAARLPQAKVTVLEGLGHLAHEEDARRIASLITT